VTRFAPDERDALADLMITTGPDAPTLCAGWTVRDLAAHLVVRGTRMDAAAGITIKALAGHTGRVQAKTATQDWPDLVAKARRRPSWAFGGLDEAANLAEYFVHHEDVRRAQPDWQPRELSPELSAALWSRIRLPARLALRRIPAAVAVTSPGYGSVITGRGGPDVELAGPPGELLLFLMGRQAHARVELTGPDEIVNSLRTARLGV
jgi:uncharacterized protein (TIGR03085 family)